MPLTNIAVQNAKPKEKPYKLADADGMFLYVAGQMPLKIAVKPLEEALRPRSSTLNFDSLCPLGDDDGF